MCLPLAVRGLIRHTVMQPTMHGMLGTHHSLPRTLPHIVSLLNTLHIACITTSSVSWRGARRKQVHRAHAQHNSDPPSATTPPLTPPPVVPDPSIAVLGQVVAAQANYVRVRVDQLVDAQGHTPDASTWDGPPPATELLCVVRALLKKIKQTVLVGDRVRVSSIDWPDARGMLGH